MTLITLIFGMKLTTLIIVGGKAKVCVTFLLLENASIILIVA
jgi:hypothetical protein